MLHYDDSERDAWALAWFSDPRCTNGYTWLVLDDGTVVELADPARRTPFFVVPALLALLVVVRHKANIARLRTGTELKIGGK